MHILKKEPLLFAIPSCHPYTKINPSNQLSADELMRHFTSETFLLSRAGSSNRIVAEHLFEEMQFTPAKIFEINGLALTRTMVAKGEDVAFLPVSGCETDPGVHYYFLAPEIYRYQVLLHKNLSNYNEVQRAFFQFILNYFQQ